MIIIAACVGIGQRPAHAAISYFASASNPADNGSLDVNVAAVAPPGAMQVGDLVVLIASAREAGITPAISATGGQAWTSQTANTTTTSQRIFWARYNGTWAVNPSVSFAAGANSTTVVMHVFRPSASANTWALDVAQTNASFAIPGAPLRNVTVTGITTLTDGALVLATWATPDDNTWALQTAGWANAGGTQYRNLDGNDTSQSAAYMVMPTAGPSGDVVNRQTANAGDAGNSSILAFKEVPVTTLATGTDPAAATVAPGAAATDVNLFTLQTSSGTEVVTSVTVDLSTNSGVGRLAITDNGGAELGFTTTPATGSNTIAVAGMSATTTLANFRVRITPLSHAVMPAVPGAAYAITAPVTAWDGGGTHTQTGSDTNTNALTIDNLSPGNVTVSSCAAGAVQIALGWTNPADADFNSAVVLRNSVAVGDTPVEGTTYAVGNTVGTSTVACVVASPAASCSDAAIATGTAYHYKIFTRDANVNYSATGVVPAGSPCTPTLADFNVVQPSADPVSGKIFTKIAGQDISVDIVARNGSGVITTDFTGTVGVELVDATTGGGVCGSMTAIKTLANQTFIAGDNGRHLISTGQFEANAYRNVKFRITYPTASPTVTSCSTDAFANRPLQFVTILARDASRTTAGTANTLSSTSSPGTGVVHNAGRPFRIDATAQNGAGSPATTTLYTPDSGQPVAVLSQCGVAAVCPASPGAVTTTGDYSAANGVITNTTASYNDVGSFNLALEDRSFSAVDAGDGTSTAVRYIPSGAAVTVGRFVPDYFSLEVASTITPRSDIVACSASPFTYMGEPMTLVFTLKARDSGNNVTPGYAGATLGALVLSNLGSYVFGAIDSTTPTPLTSRLDLTLSGATGSWSAGSADVTVPLALNRAAASPPDGPYPSFKIGMAPSDPDSVTLQTAALNLDADNSGTPERAQVGPAVTVRFGRLRLLNAYGSELVPLRVPVRAEYFNGTTWALNTADTCTPIAAATLQIGSVVQQSGSSLAFGTPPVGVGVAQTTSGLWTISLTPTTKGAGSADIRLNLGGAVTTTGCSTLSSPVGGTAPASTLEYLAGNWCGSNYDKTSTARIKFGSHKAPYIYLRERY